MLTRVSGWQGPAAPWGSSDDVVGFRRIGSAHVRSVPFELFADAQSDAAEQNNFRQIGRDIEIRVTGLAAFAGRNPFLMMALVSAAFVFVARNFLRNRFYGLMSFAVYQFLIVSKFDKELRTVIVRREQLAFVADKEATAARNFIAGFANRGGDVIRRFIVSIMFERMIG